MTNDQPKPCPHCGSDNACQRNAGPYYFVQCADCNGASGFRENTVDALAAWNRRTLPWVAVADRLPEPEQLCLWLMTPDEPGPCLAHVGMIRDMGMIELAKHWLPLSPDFFPAVATVAQGGAGSRQS